jgi:hypothetical protein
LSKVYRVISFASTRVGPFAVVATLAGIDGVCAQAVIHRTTAVIGADQWDMRIKALLLRGDDAGKMPFCLDLFP